MRSTLKKMITNLWMPSQGIDMKKQCKWCQEEKELSYFHKHSGMRDGILNKCKDCVLLSVAKWRSQNKEKRKIADRLRRQSLGFYSRDAWKQKVAEKAIGRKVSSAKYSHKRRALENNVVITEFDIFVIEEALLLTKKREEVTKFKWHVDHIVPLNYKKACGLHTAANFQVVPAQWNVSKGNRSMTQYWPSQAIKE